MQTRLADPSRRACGAPQGEAAQYDREKTMRLRQVALVSNQLDEVTAALDTVFGLKVAHVDPNVGKYGLRNAVIPCGTGFLEVVEPFTQDASAARFLARRGGDAGYMIIIQTPDAIAERDRVAGLGVRVVEIIDRPDYFCAHFHPADFGGVLASLDQQRTDADYLEPFGDWMPAGADWRKARTDEVVDIRSVSIASAAPDELARLWSRLLARPLDPREPRRLPLEKGAVVFENAPDAKGAVVSALELEVKNVEQALARARAAGLVTRADGILIGGMRFRPVA
jgi:hypothetical protein